MIAVLQQLEKDEIIAYHAEHTDARITFLVPREDDITIHMIAKEIKQQNKQKKEQVAAVIAYIQNDNTCKSQQILSYFGENNGTECGICSVCIRKKQKGIPGEIAGIIEEEIIKVLRQKSLTSRALVETLTFREAYVLEVLRQLLEKEKIRVNTKNEYEVTG